VGKPKGAHFSYAPPTPLVHFRNAMLAAFGGPGFDYLACVGRYILWLLQNVA